jgi:hypothetical protein
MIATAGSTVAEGQEHVAAAAGSGAFGGEPAGAAFEAMCARAGDALGSLADTMGQLADNTAAASQGYAITDKGAIPTTLRIVYRSDLPGETP